jgi:hypothetical protein
VFGVELVELGERGGGLLVAVVGVDVADVVAPGRAEPASMAAWTALSSASTGPNSPPPSVRPSLLTMTGESVVL